jgi:ACR3 family arsenite efflux pump ArsB
MSKGNMEAAVKMTVFGLLFGSFLTPVYIKALMGAAISIPVSNIFIQISVIVLLPMLLGHLTQSLIIRKYGKEKYLKEIKKKFPPVSTLGVLAVVFIAMALKARSIMADPIAFFALIPPLLLLYLVNIGLSTFIGRTFFNREDGLALVYGTVLRNLSIALAIAMTSFGKEGSAIALIIALGYIIQIQISAWYVKLSPMIFGQKETALSERTEKISA